MSPSTLRVRKSVFKRRSIITPLCGWAWTNGKVPRLEDAKVVPEPAEMHIDIRVGWRRRGGRQDIDLRDDAGGRAGAPNGLARAVYAGPVAEEACAFLVGVPVFKTGGRRHPSPAGS